MKLLRVLTGPLAGQILNYRDDDVERALDSGEAEPVYVEDESGPAPAAGSSDDWPEPAGRGKGK